MSNRELVDENGSRVTEGMIEDLLHRNKVSIKHCEESIIWHKKHIAEQRDIIRQLKKDQRGILEALAEKRRKW